MVIYSKDGFIFLLLDIVSDEVKQDAALVEIDKLLQLNGRHISEIVGMPSINTCDIVDYTNSLILQELSYDRPALRKLAASILSTLTDEQTSIYETIMRYVGTSLPGFFLFTVMEAQEKLICGML